MCTISARMRYTTTALLFSLILALNHATHARDMSGERRADGADADEMRSLLAQSFSQHPGDSSDYHSSRRVNTALKDSQEEDISARQHSKETPITASQHEIGGLAEKEASLQNSKSKLVISDSKHNKKAHSSIKSELNSRKFHSTTEEDIAANKVRSNIQHTVSIDIVPHRKETNAKWQHEIDPLDTAAHSDTLHLQPAIKQSHSQDNHKHDQFNNLWQTVDAIYWSPQLEHLTAVGFSDTQAVQWRHKLEMGRVSDLSEGCGRMQNRLVTFEDGSQMCARYRINTDQIQGEVYSYYLAQVLGIDNVPPAILDRADASSTRWKGVAKAMDAAKWNPRKILVLTPFVHDLTKVYIPEELRYDDRDLSPTTASLRNKSVEELSELRQWSDLIILDYLTANVDRVVNNMFNLQWSAGMMSAPTHNLERAGASGPLIFMDNESGLLHSYRLLDKYSHYHDKMLRALCIFRRSTADAIKKYHKTNLLAADMKELFKKREVLSEKLAWLPHANIQTLTQRLAAVYRQIIHCEHKYQHR